MRIRTQFIVSTVVFGAVLLIVSASVIATSQQVERLNRQFEVAARIERDASELSYLWNDYLLYRESQQRARWEAKFASFSDDVLSLDPGSPEQRVLANNIKANQQRLKAVFAEVVSAQEGETKPQDAATVQSFVEVSWSRMAVQNQGIFFDASRLSQILRVQVDQLRQTNIVLGFVLLGILGAYYLTNYLIVYRRAIQSLAELQAGTKIIGSGNLDLAIEVKRNDEVGDLARAFNRMTASLKGVTASKAELEREMSERRRVEAERERLLAALQDQTKQLQAQNEELQAQSEELEVQNEELQAQEVELLRLAQEAHRERERAEAAVKARDEFISIAAHELKTPVTSLQGFAQLMQREMGKTGAVDPARLSRAMERIEQQSKRLTKLTEQLLNLSRLQSGKLVLSLEQADLSALVKGVVGSLQHNNPERSLEVRDGGPATARIDPLRVEQVVTNLIDNALKFSPAGTPIEVSVGAKGPEWLEIAVRDHGIGIPEEKRGRIFERFYQAHAEGHYGGMGIGLSVSHQIVEMHGGTIRVEAPKDGGSRFIVQLPSNGSAASPPPVDE